jgi:hypothetical protein
MKQGQTIDEVLETIRTQAQRERDFIAPQKALQFAHTTAPGELHLQVGGDYLHCNDVFLGQAQEAAGIPKKYFDRCMEKSPDLAAYNLNHWFEKSPDNKLVRTFRAGDPFAQLGTARALLSPSYDRTWGHAPMAAALQLALEDLKDVQFVSCRITDNKMYMKALLPWLTMDFKSAKVGDAVTGGFQFDNSETGGGRGRLAFFLEIKMCNNGMTMPDFGLSKVHRGKKETTIGELQINYANDTLLARRAALTGELRDTLKQMCTMDTLAKVKAQIEGVSSVELADPMGSIKMLGSSYELTEAETKLVEQEFVKGGDITRWGLVQALTAASAKVDSYDRASELEQLGGKIITLPATEWQVLDKAA